MSEDLKEEIHPSQASPNIFPVSGKDKSLKCKVLCPCLQFPHSTGGWKGEGWVKKLLKLKLFKSFEDYVASTYLNECAQSPLGPGKRWLLQTHGLPRAVSLCWECEKGWLSALTVLACQACCSAGGQAQALDQGCLTLHVPPRTPQTQVKGRLSLRLPVSRLPLPRPFVWTFNPFLGHCLAGPRSGERATTGGGLPRRPAAAAWVDKTLRWRRRKRPPATG